MAMPTKLTKEDIEKGRKILYHHVDCGNLSGIKITLTEEGRKYRAQLAILGISSKEPISAGLKAVDASPFKTVFVVDEASGKVLYALSKNEEYVSAAKKKKPKPEPGPRPVPVPVSFCCQICDFMGGTSCDELADGSCICFGADRGTSGAGLNDALETLAR